VQFGQGVCLPLAPSVPGSPAERAPTPSSFSFLCGLPAWEAVLRSLTPCVLVPCGALEYPLPGHHWYVFLLKAVSFPWPQQVWPRRPLGGDTRAHPGPPLFSPLLLSTSSKSRCWPWLNVHARTQSHALCCLMGLLREPYCSFFFFSLCSNVASSVYGLAFFFFGFLCSDLVGAELAFPPFLAAAVKLFFFFRVLGLRKFLLRGPSARPPCGVLWSFPFDPPSCFPPFILMVTFLFTRGSALSYRARSHGFKPSGLQALFS